MLERYVYFKKKLIIKIQFSIWKGLYKIQNLLIEDLYLFKKKNLPMFVNQIKGSGFKSKVNKYINWIVIKKGRNFQWIYDYIRKINQVHWF